MQDRKVTVKERENKVTTFEDLERGTVFRILPKRNDDYIFIKTDNGNWLNAVWFNGSFGTPCHFNPGMPVEVAKSVKIEIEF